MEYLSVSETARELDCCRATVWRAIQSGELPATRTTRRGPWRIRREDLNRLKPPTPPAPVDLTRPVLLGNDDVSEKTKESPNKVYVVSLDSPSVAICLTRKAARGYIKWKKQPGGEGDNRARTIFERRLYNEEAVVSHTVQTKHTLGEYAGGR